MENPEKQKIDQPIVGSTGARWRAIAGLIALSLLLPIVLFWTAGRTDWVMGWVFVGAVLLVTFGTRLLLLRVNPGLLAERASSFGGTDTKSWDRILIPVLIAGCPLAMWLTAGLSQRFGWTPRIPVPIQVAGLVVLLAGGGLSSWAMLINRFFSTVVRIQKDRGHTVVTTGPYRIVRHPGYAGAVLVNLASPLVLDACWAFIPGVISIIAIVVRTALEDRTLKRELPGYDDYTRCTHYRILPGVW